MHHSPSNPPATPYRGRFAPTPSGPLHLGSLLTATASYLQARSMSGQWLLRIDDLDQPRCVPGIDSQILRQLERHGLHWDASPRYQRRHLDEYQSALATLEQHSRLYACRCTRAQLQHSAHDGPDGPVYPGTCRDLDLPHAGHALRLRIAEGQLQFVDAWQGLQVRNAAHEIGDFTVRRADAVIGYQLACAVDEHAQCITEVVRGADLLGSTFRQLQVMAALEFAPPQYRHLPVLLDARGLKLSKQNHADPLDERKPGANLARCLQWLGQQPPVSLLSASAQEVLNWGVAHWRSDAVATVRHPTVEGAH
ncbi:tRNA glutamyl-Q(34) synthetase GluQRS [Sinimarinibacterium sp. CAU 1509]|nr:tRNA glutamyl-Q(34) synthetase GluQRS [Sinimarinibacterium sp. CAU 1509]